MHVLKNINKVSEHLLHQHGTFLASQNIAYTHDVCGGTGVLYPLHLPLTSP